MIKNFYEKDRLSAIEAKFEAQKIAFAPFVFQATITLRDLGILQAIEKGGKKGISLEVLVEKVDVSTYGVKVLVEAGLGIGLLLLKDHKYSLTNTGYFVLHDEMTRVNMNFMQDVNYQGAFSLKDSILNSQPEGLRSFGQWPTIYQALSSLPAKAQKSWFDFDHFYSDGAFPSVLPHVFEKESKPKRLLDVGGNTGKWALECVKYDPDVHVTIADLPGQLRMAERNIENAGFGSRVSYSAVDVLNPEESFPSGFDAIWMSQFLDCFSQKEILSILKRVSKSLRQGDSLYILETFWNRQQHEAASFCLQQTSLYFTCMANGNSQMYHSDDLKDCIEQSGLKVVLDTDQCGISHTLLQCVKK